MIDFKNIEVVYEAYKNDELTDVELNLLQIALDENSEFKKQWDELVLLDQQFQETPMVDPDPSIGQHFEQILAYESKKQVNNKSNQSLWSRLAAAVALIILGGFSGFWLGRETDSERYGQLQEEMQQVKQIIWLSNLQQRSASSRIMAIETLNDQATVADETLEALIRVLNTDSNINVRMTAAEGLYRFGDQDKVRLAFAESLVIQQDPALQIILIDMLVQLEEKSALDELQQIVADDQVIQQVKNKAYEGISKLL